MIKTRDAVLCYQETQSADKSTKTIDLDIVDPVSALGFEFDATNGTTNNRNNPLTRAITKLEIVDGAEVLTSLSFEQAQALQFYKTGKQPQLREDEGPSAGSPIGCMILFGRRLWDRDYALDLTKFANPQLKITWDLTNIRAVDAATAFATGTTKISAWAKVMKGQSPPGKYLIAKEIESWTGGTSGDKKHEIPTDRVYQMLMLRSYLTQKDVDENITKIKLTCDTDDFIPLERYTKQFDAEMAQLFGDVVVWKRLHAGHNDTVWLPVNKEPQLHMNVLAMGYMASYGWCWSGEAQLFVADATGAADSTDRRLDALIEGHALHATLPIPLGVMDEPDTWFDPTAYKKLELICTEAYAAANSLVAVQVRPN
jgi:hypothetical protein